MPDLKAVESHFRFGENWASFARMLTPRRIDKATTCLKTLVPEGLDGKSFLDIGSGSGLSALAAANIGAGQIIACDIDPDSVRTTEMVLSQHSANRNFTTRLLSVFDMNTQDLGHFDVVHSWGVLHHTGSMWEAVGKASDLVKPDGLLILALYLKTPFCGLWRVEKRFYTKAPRAIQNVLFHAFRTVARLYILARGGSPAKVWAEYEAERGMDQDHDIRDWLGGYPYESASPEEVDSFLAPRGFQKIRAFNTKPRSGLMGTGCAEFVYRRSVAEAAAPAREQVAAA